MGWKDRSNTSGEFELSLDINDQDFLDTVKNEYRSSSPSWANTKFTFPMKEEKIGKKSLENIPCLPEEISAERSVSVRKRMEDEESKDAAAEVSDNLTEASKEATEETDKEEPV